MFQPLNSVTPYSTAVFRVMDNASFHKRSDMIEAIDEGGFICDFLPPYSPDLNPIEKKWAQVKSIRRKKRCSLDELFSEHTDYSNVRSGFIEASSRINNNWKWQIDAWLFSSDEPSEFTYLLRRDDHTQLSLGYYF